MFRSLICAVSVVAFGAASGMAEEPRSDTVQIVSVRYADLDPQQTTDASALLSRLRAAAERACGQDAVERPSPQARRAMHECRAEALDTVVARINEPELTRLYTASR